ncbi:hypothetical protein LR004_02520, partial [Candidatus Gracilibacteria bacterium]|nr:hypothetical protein [Candidatus Gracilibacteria bacterium]
MILKIILVILLCIFTLYFILLAGVITIMFAGASVKQLLMHQDVILLGFCVFVLYAYLMYSFVKGIIKKEISKNYLYSFIGFFIILIIFYFGYYTQYNSKILDEKQFETKLQKVEVKDEDNGLKLLGNLLQGKDFHNLDIIISNEKFYKAYYCTAGNKEKHCDTKILKQAQEYYKNNSEILERINSRVEKINESKYFKQNLDAKRYVDLRGLSILSRQNIFHI